MGWGDDLMWLGDAEQRYRETGRKQRPTEAGRTRPQSPLWHYCDCVDMHDGASLPIRVDGLRPYRQSPPWHAKPARLTLSEEEKIKGLHWKRHKPYWLIQPHTKPRAYYPNKQWPLRKWQELVDTIRQQRPHTKLITLVEQTSPNYGLLQGVDYHITENIRLTLPAMENTELCATQEGYWHHLAAAYAKPCVVLYGGNTSPHRSEEHSHWGTGYNDQLNITDTDPETPCYKRTECEHCEQAWQRLDANEVYQQLELYLKEREL